MSDITSDVVWNFNFRLECYIKLVRLEKSGTSNGGTLGGKNEIEKNIGLKEVEFSREFTSWLRIQFGNFRQENSF